MNIKNFFKVSFWTFFSRVLGLIRDIMLARYLGAGIMADMFFVALKIPNLFRRFFAEGSMQAVFIPIFSQKFSINKNKAKIIASQIFSIFFTILFIFVIILEIFTPYVVKIMAPGFVSKGLDVFERTIFLVRITLPYLFFISLVSFYSSILNTIYKFSLVAFLPALLNIFLIIFIYYGDMLGGKDIGASFGVLFAGIVQLIFVLYGCYKSGWLVGFTFFKKNMKLALETKSFFKKLLPVIMGAGIYQINIIIDIIAASLLSSGAISYLFYADRIYQLPLALIGISIATVVLPSISSKGNETSNNDNKIKALLLGLALSIPASSALFILSKYIMLILFFGGSFSILDVHNTALCIMVYVICLPANVIIKIILPFFYSKGDIKTPLYSTGICLVINIILVFSLAHRFGFLGIASATAIASYINFIILFGFVIFKKYLQLNKTFYSELIKIIIINVVFFVCLFLFNCLIEYFNVSIMLKRLLIIFIIVISVLFVFFMLKLFQSILYLDIMSVIKKKKA